MSRGTETASHFPLGRKHLMVLSSRRDMSNKQIIGVQKRHARQGCCGACGALTDILQKDLNSR